MNKLLLLVGTLVSLQSYAQDIIFSDDFETGAGNWTLNGGTGNNQWSVNNEYTGFSGFIDDTPLQPGSFNGGSQSTYMHITNTQICGGAGVCNANFDTGSSSNQSATQTASVSTTGYTNVTFDFYYICAGASGSAYGMVEYSTDNGSTWNTAGGPYSGVTTWTAVSAVVPGFNNQAMLKFRFRWVNGGSGLDPAFSVDEVQLSGVSGNSVALATGAIPTSNYCNNVATNITVPFIATGAVNSGNIYQAHLSNASGSFASPTLVGSLASNATGSLSINATIPSGLPTGSNYQIRVDATDPASTGAASATVFTVNNPPAVGFISLPANGVICIGESATIQASGGNAYSWSPSGSLDNSNTSTVSASPTTTTTYNVLVTASTGCSATATFTVTVDQCASIGENYSVELKVFPNPAADKLFVDAKGMEQITEMTITDLSGRIIEQFSGLQSSIDLSGFKAGTYIVSITNAGGTTQAAFIKQ